MHGAIEAKEGIVVIRVKNLLESREWYSKLFGKKPDLEPFPGNVEFKIGGAWLQISKGEVTPSSWSFQIEVENLSHERERLLAEGIKSTEIGIVPGVISWFDLRDPDGNFMRWFQVLTPDSKATGGEQNAGDLEIDPHSP